MENKKDIGKVISDKLNSLEKTPRENVWNGISYELQKKKKRRIGFFFFWTKTIGLLLVGAVAAWYVYNQNDGFNTLSPKDSKESIIEQGKDRKTITNDSNPGNTEIHNAQSNLNNEIATEDANSTENKNAVETQNKLKNNNSLNNSNALNKTNSVTSKSKKPSVKKTNNTNSVSKKSKSIKNKSSQFSRVRSKKSTKKAKVKSKTDQETLNQSAINTEQNTSTLFDPKSLQNNSTVEKSKEVDSKKTDSLVAKKDKEKTKTIYMSPEDKKEKDSAKTYRKFDIDAFVSPTIYGQFANTSTVDRRLDSISKHSKITLSYGLGLTYELSEKFSIRVGYNKIALETTTKNATVNTQNYYGIKYNPNVTNQTIYNASNNAEKMDITQKFSYSEIPLELKYKFLDKKIGMQAIFGFSYLMLHENTVTIQTNNGYSQQIGATNFIMDTSVSINIGIGFDYEIFKNTKVFAEPMFNYQFMSFDNSNPKPYFFGIHTGIRYTILNK
jgi:hypothetical protein